LTEGPFDAIAVEGIAVLSNEIGSAQAQRLKNLGLPIIVVPDRDLAGAKLINAALEHGWSVSIPPWDTHIKDVSDAVKEYGKMYTVWSILNYCESNQLKIHLMKKKLEKQSHDQN
jgi:nitrogen fixation protein